MVYIGVFILGLVVGGIVISVVYRRRAIKSLVIDRSDPEDGPYLFLELPSDGPSVIERNKYVTFKVEKRNYISHK